MKNNPIKIINKPNVSISIDQKRWSGFSEESNHLFVLGYAFHGSDYYAGDEFAAFLLPRMVQGMSPENIVQGLNGFFAIIAVTGNSVWMAVDHVRSYPLYYRVVDNHLVVSDSFKSTAGSDDAYSFSSVIDLATAGFVTSGNTVCEEIYALQAGEIVRFDDGSITNSRHFEYICTYEKDDCEGALVERLDAVTEACMKRAIEFCDGRQVALPLSGGLDSRLIASMLKRLGYENVFCFAYGLPGNYESAKSREVAETLGYPWKHLEYTQENLRHALKSEEAHRYHSFGHGGISLPFVDDWVALHTLKKEGLIDEDAVFMPGQSGDFICGSHLKCLFHPEWHDDPEDVFGAIIKKHFSNWEDVLADEEVHADIISKLEAQAENFNLGSEVGRAAFYEYFECHERQVKYVINGGRAYEYFGYDWTYPLWDKEMVEFWRPISISLKMDSYLYRKYLATFDPFDLFQGDARKERWSPDSYVKRESRSANIEERLCRVPLLGILARFRQQHRKHKSFLRRNPLGYPLGFGYRRYVWKELGKRHHLSLVLKDFMIREYGIDIHDYLLGRK